MVKIYDSLTKNKLPLDISKNRPVRIYTCGVTVYDHCHIGHGRSLYTFDYIRNYLVSKGLNVIFIRNITDIDDKILIKAKKIASEENISINQAWEKTVNTYINSYYQDLKALNISQADYEPRATEHIKDIIEFTQSLIKKNTAYEKNGSVYFRVRRFPEYGKLSHKNIDDLLNSVRIENDPEKEDPLDFALWKKAKENEVYWDSPWGKGRPGWHIECSVMANKYLGDTLDIHGGGRDLIFPHHENEIAQSESLTGKTFAKIWMHHGLISIDSQKMSKSLKNFVTLKEFLNKYSSDTLKIFYLSAHWRSPLDFTQKKIEEADRIRERLYALWQKVKNFEEINITDRDLTSLKEKFTSSMDDDFNAPKAIACLFDLITLVYKNENNTKFLKQAKKIAFYIFDVFSLFKSERELDKDTIAYIETKISERKILRARRQYQQADAIRQELLKQNIVLEDAKNGETRWRIK